MNLLCVIIDIFLGPKQSLQVILPVRSSVRHAVNLCLPAQYENWLAKHLLLVGILVRREWSSTDYFLRPSDA